MIPKRWLIERAGELYVMDGYADDLAAVRAWALRMLVPADRVRVTELKDKGLEIFIHQHVTAEYR